MKNLGYEGDKALCDCSQIRQRLNGTPCNDGENCLVVKLIPEDHANTVLNAEFNGQEIPPDILNSVVAAVQAGLSNVA